MVGARSLERLEGGEASQEDAESARGVGKVEEASQRVKGTRNARVTRANAYGG